MTPTEIMFMPLERLVDLVERKAITMDEIKSANQSKDPTVINTESLFSGEWFKDKYGTTRRIKAIGETVEYTRDDAFEGHTFFVPRSEWRRMKREFAVSQ